MTWRVAWLQASIDRTGGMGASLVHWACIHRAHRGRMPRRRKPPGPTPEYAQLLAAATAAGVQVSPESVPVGAPPPRAAPPPPPEPPPAPAEPPDDRPLLDQVEAEAPQALLVLRRALRGGKVSGIQLNAARFLLEHRLRLERALVQAQAEGGADEAAVEQLADVLRLVRS